MVNNITYSKRLGHKRAPMFEHDDEPAVLSSPKRHKTNEPDEFQMVQTSPGIKGNNKSSLNKKGLRDRNSRFRGPTSLPEEAPDDGPAHKKNRGALDPFDEYANDHHQPLIKKQKTIIHGSLDEFKATMKEARESKTHHKEQRGKYHQLPTPPADGQRKVHQLAMGQFQSLKTNASNVETVSKVQGESQIASRAEVGTKHVPYKMAYFSKTYQAERSVPPCTNILGKRLSKNSKEIRLWSVNQATSPFLRLPDETRNSIYEYVLGGNTINIGYKTYTTKFNEGKPSEVLPVFKYCCTVYDKRGKNPFGRKHNASIQVSHGFTLLNHVCRQLYMETATLPYELNTMSFDSHNIFFNMLAMERRLPQKHLDTIETVVLPETLPQPNMLSYLRNLKIAYLGVGNAQSRQGVYRVIRREGEEPELIHKAEVDSKASYNYSRY